MIATPLRDNNFGDIGIELGKQELGVVAYAITSMERIYRVDVALLFVILIIVCKEEDSTRR